MRTTLLLLLAACAATYRSMPDRTAEMDELARAAEDLPCERGRAAGATVGGRAVKLYYRQTRAEGEWLVVLLHGVLSDSRTWEYVTGDLGQDHALLLLDLPGCGLSDKPSPGDVGPSGYSPTALARHVCCAVRERLAASDRPPRVALVGHSLGSMVILRMLGDAALREEFADVLDRVERVVLLSPVDFAVEKTQPMFTRVLGLSGVKVTIADVTEILQESTARALRQGAVEPRSVPRVEAERMVEVLRDGRRRRAAQAMIREAVPFTGDEVPDWPRIRALVRDYARVDRPCLLLHGECDETFGVAVAYKLQAQLPDAWLRVLADAKHALPSEAPRRCAAEIRAFLADGGRGRDRVVDESFGRERLPALVARGARTPLR
ncbi:MAG TPA: alpha/beta hydrolase [Planctomycetota bacterium]|nr:alpha/beta hydrolase [Planctomycetota bacterium]